MESVKDFLSENKRYSHFIFLDNPVPFNVLCKNKNYDLVQVYSVSIDEDKDNYDLIGFCGQFSWKENQLTALDYDSYNEDMLILGYEKGFDQDGDICLDVLVGNDW